MNIIAFLAICVAWYFARFLANIAMMVFTTPFSRKRIPVAGIIEAAVRFANMATAIKPLLPIVTDGGFHFVPNPLQSHPRRIARIKLVRVSCCLPADPLPSRDAHWTCIAGLWGAVYSGG